jgi:hypothetical protein
MRSRSRLLTPAGHASWRSACGGRQLLTGRGAALNGSRRLMPHGRTLYRLTVSSGTPISRCRRLVSRQAVETRLRTGPLRGVSRSPPRSRLPGAAPVVFGTFSTPGKFPGWPPGALRWLDPGCASREPRCSAPAWGGRGSPEVPGGPGGAPGPPSRRLRRSRPGCVPGAAGSAPGAAPEVLVAAERSIHPGSRLAPQGARWLLRVRIVSRKSG